MLMINNYCDVFVQLTVINPNGSNVYGKNSTNRLKIKIKTAVFQFFALTRPDLS